MFMKMLFGAALVISFLLAYQKYSHEATVNTMSEADPAFIIGQQNAPHTIIMFFDYNSKWSRRSHPILMQLISQNPNIRIVLRDYPGITSFSETISRIVLATREKGKYMETHSAIMSIQGDIDESRLRSVVEQLGMNYDELLDLGYKPEVTRVLDENRQAAFFLQIQSAPSFVVDGQVMGGGGYTVDDFKAAIQNQR